MKIINGFDIDTLEGATAYLENECINIQYYTEKGMNELRTKTTSKMKNGINKRDWIVIDGWKKNDKGKCVDKKGSVFPSIVFHGSVDDYRESLGRSGVVINCSHDQEMETIMSNAYLMAAAPDMLEALQGLIDPITGLVADFIANELGAEKAYAIEQAIEKAIK